MPESDFGAESGAVDSSSLCFSPCLMLLFSTPQPTLKGAVEYINPVGIWLNVSEESESAVLADESGGRTEGRESCESA